MISIKLSISKYILPVFLHVWLFISQFYEKSTDYALWEEDGEENIRMKSRQEGLDW